MSTILPQPPAVDSNSGYPRVAVDSGWLWKDRGDIPDTKSGVGVNCWQLHKWQSQGAEDE